MFALLRHSYPHNVRELESVLERAALEAGEDDRQLGLTRNVAASLGVNDLGSPDAFAAAADGTWFRAPGAPRVTLTRRATLARVLRALLDARRDTPDRALSAEELFQAGWPGERIRPASASGRVYVALTTLRNLGLRQLLLRSDQGYYLDPHANVETVSVP
jgi:hypothetical protein